MKLLNCKVLFVMLHLISAEWPSNRCSRTSQFSWDNAGSSSQMCLEIVIFRSKTLSVAMSETLFDRSRLIYYDPNSQLSPCKTLPGIPKACLIRNVNRPISRELDLSARSNREKRSSAKPLYKNKHNWSAVVIKTSSNWAKNNTCGNQSITKNGCTEKGAKHNFGNPSSPSTVIGLCIMNRMSHLTLILCPVMLTGHSRL